MNFPEPSAEPPRSAIAICDGPSDPHDLADLHRAFDVLRNIEDMQFSGRRVEDAVDYDHQHLAHFFDAGPSGRIKIHTSLGTSGQSRLGLIVVEPPQRPFPRSLLARNPRPVVVLIPEMWTLCDDERALAELVAAQMRAIHLPPRTEHPADALPIDPERIYELVLSICEHHALITDDATGRTRRWFCAPLSRRPLASSPTTLRSDADMPELLGGLPAFVRLKITPDEPGRKKTVGALISEDQLLHLNPGDSPGTLGAMAAYRELREVVASYGVPNQ